MPCNVFGVSCREFLSGGVWDLAWSCFLQMLLNRCIASSQTSVQRHFLKCFPARIGVLRVALAGHFVPVDPAHRAQPATVLIAEELLGNGQNQELSYIFPQIEDGPIRTNVLNLLFGPGTLRSLLRDVNNFKVCRKIALKLVQASVAGEPRFRSESGFQMNLPARFLKFRVNENPFGESGVQAKTRRLSFEIVLVSPFGELRNIDCQITHRVHHPKQEQPLYTQKQGLNLAST